MFEIVFLGGIAAVIYRRRLRSGDLSRADLHRALIGLGRGVGNAVAAVLQSGPDLARQCLADVKSLAHDVTGLARGRSRVAARPRSTRIDVAPARGTARTGAAPATPTRAVSRLQRSYIAGRISFAEYVDGVRRLQPERAPASPGGPGRPGRGKVPPRSGGEAGNPGGESLAGHLPGAGTAG